MKEPSTAYYFYKILTVYDFALDVVPFTNRLYFLFYN